MRYERKLEARWGYEREREELVRFEAVARYNSDRAVAARAEARERREAALFGETPDL